MNQIALNHHHLLNRSEQLQLDFWYLNETTSVNKIFQLELAQIFLSEVPMDLEAIALALSKKDLFAASKIAHSMKSTVGYMGFAHNIGTQLTEFEMACIEENDISLLLSAFEVIKNNLEKAKELVNNSFFQSTNFVELASDH